MVDKKPHNFRVIESGGAVVGPNEADIEQVGAFLREARENTGRSLADVAATLRIRARFLQAIEDGRYSDLPGPTYAVGFIRTYADYLQLDTEALVDQFKSEASSVEVQPDLEFPTPPTVGWFPTGTVVSSCAILAAAVFAGWFYIQNEDSQDVAAIPSPPGFESASGLASAVGEAADIGETTQDVVVVEAPQPASAVADESVADVVDESEEAVTVADAAIVEADEPDASVSTETASNVEDVADESSVSDVARATPEPASTEAAPQPAEPAVIVRADALPAIEEPASAPAEVAEAPVLDEDEPVSVSANAAEPSGTEQPAAAPEQIPEVASLPNIPSSSGEPTVSGQGRTYGVANQEARVVIGARADSWVQVLDSNQNVLLTRMLRPGDRYLVPSRDDLVMLTGNAGGLIISVDGEPVPRIGSDGAILHNVRLDVELLKSGRAVIQ